MEDKEKNNSFHSVYTRNVKRLIRMAFRITGNHEDSEDLADEALFIFWQKSLSEQIIKPDAYVTGIMANLLGNYLKSKKNEDTISIESIRDIAEKEETVSIEEYFPSGLSEGERKILILRIEKQYTYAEISKILDLAEISCRSRFFRAKEHLKTLLEEKIV